MNQPHSQFQPASLFYPLSSLPELSSSTKISAEHFLKLGNQHYNVYLSRGVKKELEMAVVHYKEALDLNANLAEVHFKLAAALWDQGSISVESALDYCDAALRLAPDCSDAYLFKGYFLRRAGHLTEAMALFRKAIAMGGQRPSAKAHMALGQTIIQQASASLELSPWVRLSQVGMGVARFAWGCSLLPSDAASLQVLLSALMADAKVVSLVALGRFFKALHLRPITTGVYEWAARALPQEPIFYHLLGDLHTQGDNLDGALYCYNRARELDPDNPQLYKKLGQVYHECKDTDNAARSLEKIVDTEAADFETLYTLAQIYTDRADYMRALYYFKELLAQRPDNPYLHSNIGYILFKMEDYDGAIQEYQEAVRLGQDPLWTATVAQTLGTIYYQVKQDLEAASRVFRMACQLDPSDLDCLSMLGDIYTEQGQFEMAIDAYEYIISLEPDNAECYNYLGYLLWQLDRNDEAVTAYQKAIMLNFHNPIAYNNLGVIYLDEKCLLSQALEMFEQALNLNPGYTLACFNVARAHEAMGHTSEAAKGYTEALTLNVENPELSQDEIQDRLARLFEV